METAAAPTAGGRVNRRGTARAKSVILLIGDGMGHVQREAGRLLTVGAGGALVMDTLPHTGIVATSCADPEAAVTDSAAAATALASGVKTRNGAVGLDPDGNRVPTVLELAKRAGKATGLITTCQITDATPAAFAAHVPNRKDQSEIARQFVEETGVDVLLGGGEDYWHPADDPGAFPDHPPKDPAEGSRGTRGDLVGLARRLGYAYVTSADALRAASGRKILGLFANQEMFEQRPEGEGDRYEPVVSLAEMTAKALDVLSRNPNGFFLMVEEAAIDRMAHQNNARLALKGVQELDQAVAVAKAFAERHPDTLVIVTADHECGGLELGDAVLAEPTARAFPVADGEDQFALAWATTGHTDVAVPLMAMGPGAERLAGTIENTDIFHAMVAAMGLTTD